MLPYQAVKRFYPMFLSYDDNSSIIVWNDGNYVYSINGDLCKNDIIEMANSVNPTK